MENEEKRIRTQQAAKQQARRENPAFYKAATENMKMTNNTNKTDAEKALDIYHDTVYANGKKAGWQAAQNGEKENNFIRPNLVDWTEAHNKIKTALATQSKLESGEYVMVQGWQPIETAPKDGVEKVLVYDNGNTWLVYTGGANPSGRFYTKPTYTHWMPIPDIAAHEGEE